MSLKDYRRLVVILFLISYFGYGLLVEFGLYYRWQDYPKLAFVITTLLLLFSWYRFDSEILGFKRTALMNFLIIGLAGIGLPVYLFRSRGLKKGAIALGLFLLFLLAGFISCVLGVMSGIGIVGLIVKQSG